MPGHSHADREARPAQTTPPALSRDTRVSVLNTLVTGKYSRARGIPADRLDGCLVEQRDRIEHGDLLHVPVPIDEGFQARHR